MSDQPAAVATFRDYLELTKPRLSLLSVVTALVGYLASRPPHQPLKLVFVVVGTSLAAGGVAALNQWLEHETDAQMTRTAVRPIPTGKVTTGSAFVLGTLMCIGSLFLLFALVNPLAAMFTLLTIICYLGWYTPAKKWSMWSTEIGAVAGAFPPLIGWTAGEGRVTALGWILFGILYFWQIPHFMAVAWTYRRDYSAVHFPMLPVRDESGRRVAAWSLVNTIALLVESPACGARARQHCLWCRRGRLRDLVPLAGNCLPGAAGRDDAARKLFFGSIIYLPLVLGALVADRLLAR